MTELTPMTPPTLHAAVAIAGVRHGLDCWSKALSEMAHGLTAASLAQMNLAQSMFTVASSAMVDSPRPAHPRDAARRWADTAALECDTAVQGYLRINDELAASFFKAAENLLEALKPEAAAVTEAAAALVEKTENEAAARTRNAMAKAQPAAEESAPEPSVYAPLPD